MTKKSLLIGMMVVGLLSSMAMAYTVNAGSSGGYSMSIAGSDFVNWGLINARAERGGTGANFATYNTAYTNNTTVSGGDTPNGLAWYSIPFYFKSPVRTAIISFNSAVDTYSGNLGYCEIYLVKDNVETLIYRHANSDLVTSGAMTAAEAYYNYNGDAPTGDGVFSTSTDISDLVAGTGSFWIKFVSQMGYSAWLYNGGVFMSSAGTNPDFTLEGVVEPMPGGLCVETDAVGDFDVDVPGEHFTDWAISVGGKTSGDVFATYNIPKTNNTTVSGVRYGSSSASMTIPFHFPAPIETLSISYSSEVEYWSANIGYCKVYAIVDGVETLIYSHYCSMMLNYGMPAEEAYFNYDGVAPSEDGIFCATTDLTSLLAGVSSFSLRFESKTGNTSWLYNGGVFFSSAGADPDFGMTGTVALDTPDMAVVTDSGSGAYSVTATADNFSNWAMAGGATRGSDDPDVTFATTNTVYTNSQCMNGATVPGESAWIQIPFRFDRPLDTAVFDFNSQVNPYGNNWGIASVYAVVDGIDILVYKHGSPDYVTNGMDPSEIYYNFNGLAPTGDTGAFCTSTDISSLVSGRLGFDLKFVSSLGWSGWFYNGGVFMVGDAATPDFTLAGAVQTDADPLLVIFTPNAGTFVDSVDVQVDCLTSGADIYYTTDGSEPSETNGTLITSGASITVTENSTLRCFAVTSGETGVVSDSGAYTIVSQTQNTAFDVPDIAAITADGDLSDWSDASDWSDDYIWWNTASATLTSQTKARFAWNDAADVLYVAVQTDEASVQDGGHVVVGVSRNIDGVASSGVGATQLCFDLNVDGSVLIRNEIAAYGGFGEITGVQAGCSENAGVWTYEIVIPLWNNWLDTSLGQFVLSPDDVIYVYSCMESAFETGDGTDMTYYGNPGFAYADGFTYGSALTLTAVAVIPGDANHDGAVDVGDLGILAANYGTTSGATWELGDFTGDGAVDVGDLGVLAANYGSGSSSAADFDADYAKVFGVENVAEESETSLCGVLGLPLIAGLLLVGLMLVKLDD